MAISRSRHSRQSASGQGSHLTRQRVRHHGKLASLLRIQPAALRDAGRERAAQLLEEIPSDKRPTTVASDVDSRSRAEGRRIVTQQVLGVFSTEELRAEIQRREAKRADSELYADEDEDADDAAFHQELADDLRTEQWPER